MRFTLSSNISINSRYSINVQELTVPFYTPVHYAPEPGILMQNTYMDKVIKPVPKFLTLILMEC